MAFFDDLKKKYTELLNPVRQSLSNINTLSNQYQQRVNEGKETPFFNQNNTVPQWLGLVAQDVKKRGLSEGFHDLTYPVTTNPYIRPLSDLGVSWARVSNLNAGRPSNIVNSLLGQQDWQMAPDFRDHKKRSLSTFYKGNPFGGGE